MKKHTFYIGLNDKDTKSQLINTLDAYRITTNILGVDSTIKECKGVYTHEDGTITTENTLEVVLLDFDNKMTILLILLPLLIIVMVCAITAIIKIVKGN